MTPIIETMRSLLTDGTPGSDIWPALAWAVGILLVSYTFALGLYRLRRGVERIYRLNRDRIGPDPNVLAVGTVLGRR